MAKNIKMSDLLEDAHKYLHTIGSSYAKKAREDICRWGTEALNLYYRYDVNNGEKPLYYNRTEEMKFHSVVPYYKNKGKYSYEGGAVFSSEKMDDYKYTNLTTEYIVRRAWSESWHGYRKDNSGNYVPIIEPKDITPYKYVQNKITEEYKNELLRYAIRKAKGSKYKVLRF